MERGNRRRQLSLKGSSCGRKVSVCGKEETEHVLGQTEKSPGRVNTGKDKKEVVMQSMSPPEEGMASRSQGQPGVCEPAELEPSCSLWFWVRVGQTRGLHMVWKMHVKPWSSLSEHHCGEAWSRAHTEVQVDSSSSSLFVVRV